MFYDCCRVLLKGRSFSHLYALHTTNLLAQIALHAVIVNLVVVPLALKIMFFN